MLIKKDSNAGPSRRAIIKAATGSGIMSSMSMASAFLNLQATRAMADSSAPNDNKTLVCVFLNGGNDSFNMLAPKGGEYADYSLARGEVGDGGIAIAENELKDIAGPGSRLFGLHPALTEDFTDPATGVSSGNGLQGLYNAGKLSFVSNVGSLLEPTTLVSYQGQANLPVGLFSHSDLQRHWMTSIPQDRSQLHGWGGKMADILQSCNDPSSISMNISLSGVNLFQTGKSVSPYSIDSGSDGGATAVSGYFENPNETPHTFRKIFSAVQNDLLSQTYGNLMSKTLAETNMVSMQAALEFNQVILDESSANPIITPFDSSDNLSKQLKRIAEVIAARKPVSEGGLGQRRQVFFVQLTGFDNHSALLTDHDQNLRILSKALTSFYQATIELGVENDVVTFTASDFARTLSSNGQGSDHAWGGNHLVISGALSNDGSHGKIVGDYPTSLRTPMFDGFSIDTGRGRLIPTTSVDQYYSELATWFGVASGDLADILSNLSNFTSAPGYAPLNLFA